MTLPNRQNICQRFGWFRFLYEAKCEVYAAKQIDICIALNGERR